MFYIKFAVYLALAISSIHGQDLTKTSKSMTSVEGKPCSEVLGKTARELCSKRKKFIAGTPQVDWYQAKENCEKYGFKLASITSEEENKNVMEQFRLQGLDSPTAWLAGNDLAREGNFSWAGNVKIPFDTYTNWYVGEPNNAFNNEDCVNIYPDGSFNDWNCKSNLYYICEYY